MGVRPVSTEPGGRSSSRPHTSTEELATHRAKVEEQQEEEQEEVMWGDGG